MISKHVFLMFKLTDMTEMWNLSRNALVTTYTKPVVRISTYTKPHYNAHIYNHIYICYFHFFGFQCNNLCREALFCLSIILDNTLDDIV